MNEWRKQQGEMQLHLSETQQAITRAVLEGSQLEGHFATAMAYCEWEEALNRADGTNFMHFGELMAWRLNTLPRQCRDEKEPAACAECGHLHWFGPRYGYGECPICDCQGQED